MRFVSVFFSDLFSHFSVFPRRGHVELSSSFKLFLGFDVRVENPLSVGQRKTRSESCGSLCENFDFLIGESAIEHFEIFAVWERTYLREAIFLEKRLLLRYRLLAKYSLAPYLCPQVI